MFRKLFHLLVRAIRSRTTGRGVLVPEAASPAAHTTRDPLESTGHGGGAEPDQRNQQTGSADGAGDETDEEAAVNDAAVAADGVDEPDSFWVHTLQTFLLVMFTATIAVLVPQVQGNVT